MLMQKMGYIAVGAAAALLLQKYLKTSRERALRAKCLASNGRIVAFAVRKRLTPQES